MTDTEAYTLIGERAKELAENANIQRERYIIGKTHGVNAAVDWLISAAIATLCGMR